METKQIKRKTFDPKTTPLNQQQTPYKEGYAAGYSDGAEDGALYASIAPRFDLWAVVDKRSNKVVASAKRLKDLYKEHSDGHYYFTKI